MAEELVRSGGRLLSVRCTKPGVGVLEDQDRRAAAALEDADEPVEPVDDVRGVGVLLLVERGVLEVAGELDGQAGDRRPQSGRDASWGPARRRALGGRRLQVLALMGGKQRTGLLDGFAEDVLPERHRSPGDLADRSNGDPQAGEVILQALRRGRDRRRLAGSGGPYHGDASSLGS